MNADYIMSKKALDSCDSVGEYLDALPKWDGRKRVDTMLHDYLGADDNAYTRAVSRKMLVAAIARALKPGCEVGFMPILWGESGSGKTLLLTSLAGNFKGNAFPQDVESLLIVLPGEEAESWILEITEFPRCKKDIGYLVRFVLRSTDEVGYLDLEDAMALVQKERSFLLVLTTNIDCSGIIKGNVFWPVQVHRDKKTYSIFSLDRILVDQLWAEAKELYENGEPLNLGDEAHAIYKTLGGDKDDEEK